jgi:hypothetical protein
MAKDLFARTQAPGGAENQYWQKIDPATGGAAYPPSEGIPKSDLDIYVQNSLSKADTAIQQETDPTVPVWAKAVNKPTYTAAEVGAIPASDKGVGIPTLDATGKVPLNQLPPIGGGVPSGGTPGQVLRKKTTADFDVVWSNEAENNGTGESEIQDIDYDELMSLPDSETEGKVYLTYNDPADEIPNQPSEPQIMSVNGIMANTGDRVSLKKGDLTIWVQRSASAGAYSPGTAGFDFDTARDWVMQGYRTYAGTNYTGDFKGVSTGRGIDISTETDIGLGVGTEMSGVIIDRTNMRSYNYSVMVCGASNAAPNGDCGIAFIKIW